MNDVCPPRNPWLVSVDHAHSFLIEVFKPVSGQRQGATEIISNANGNLILHFCCSRHGVNRGYDKT
jgi:hypothetical protein